MLLSKVAASTQREPSTVEDPGSPVTSISDSPISKDKPSKKQQLFLLEKSRSSAGSSTEHEPSMPLLGKDIPWTVTEPPPAQEKSPAPDFYITAAPPQGIPLSSIASRLSSVERRSIDKQLSSLTAHVRALRSQRYGQLPRVAAGAGFELWGEAFFSLLDTKLRDAEGAFVNLPYEMIRQTVSRTNRCLDIDAVEAEICVWGGLEAGTREVWVEKVEKSNVIEVGEIEFEDSATSEENSVSNEFWKVCAIGGWAGAFWGDPALLEPDMQKADPKHMLYQIYHSVVAVISSYAQPGQEQIELEARRMLNTCLTQLASKE